MESATNLQLAVETIDLALEQCTGSDDTARRMIAYYVISTYHIAAFDTFGSLALHGFNGTGKSRTIKLVVKIAHNSRLVISTSITEPYLREFLHEAYEGTACIEEGDEGAPEWLDRYLLARYQRQTGESGKMVPGSKHGEWVRQSQPIFGATVIHRRDKFESPALESRCIWVPFMQNHDRLPDSYHELDDDAIEQIKGYLQGASTIEYPKEIPVALNITARIRDTYLPILIPAYVGGDMKFIETMEQEHLPKIDLAFKDGQTFSPAGTVLKALIQVLADRTSGESLDLTKTVKVNTDIMPIVRNNYRQGMSPRGACDHLRKMGFTLKQSGGVNVVHATLPALVKACFLFGIQDDLVDAEIKKHNPMSL